MQHIAPAVERAPVLRTPPKTRGLPIIGSIPAVLKEQVDFLAHAREEYGDVYTLNLGMMQIVIANRPEHAQHILRDHAKNYSKGGQMWDAVRALVGNGLVLSEGDFWLRQRRMMQPYFHRQQLGKMADLTISAIEDGMKDWGSFAGTGDAMNFASAFSAITMKVIMKTTFGGDIAEEEIEEMSREITYALDFILPNMVTMKIPGWVPVPGRKRNQEAIEKIDAFIYRIIEKRRNEKEPGGDLLSMMIQMVDDETNAEMTNQQIRDEAITLFAAGYETTALTLAWVVHYLTQQPQIADKLYTEIDQVLPQNAHPTFEALMQLPYTRMILQEAMRLRPPAFWIPRTAVEDDEIDGYRINAGDMVAVAIYGIHHNPDVWENPDVFDPERFSPENSEGRNQFAWIPFGAGQRLCLGRDFAMMEGAFVLAMLGQRYHLHGTDHVAKSALSATLRTKDGVWATLEKRR
jgi:cytochrome P450